MKSNLMTTKIGHVKRGPYSRKAYKGAKKAARNAAIGLEHLDSVRDYRDRGSSKSRAYSIPAISLAGHGTPHDEGSVTLADNYRDKARLEAKWGVLEISEDGTVGIADAVNPHPCILDVGLEIKEPGDIEQDPAILKMLNTTALFSSENKEAFDTAVTPFFRRSASRANVAKTSTALPGLVRGFFRNILRRGSGHTAEVSPELCGCIVRYVTVKEVSSVEKKHNVITHIWSVMQRNAYVGQTVSPDVIAYEDWEPTKSLTKDWVLTPWKIGATEVAFPNWKTLALIGSSGAGKSYRIKQYLSSLEQVDRDTASIGHTVNILVLCGERPASNANQDWLDTYDGKVFWITHLSIPLLYLIVKSVVEELGPDKRYNVVLESATPLITGADGAAISGGIPGSARTAIDELNAIPAAVGVPELRMIAIFNTPPKGGENWEASIIGATDLSVVLDNEQKLKYVRCRTRDDIWDSSGSSIKEEVAKHGLPVILGKYRGGDSL